MTMHDNMQGRHALSSTEKERFFQALETDQNLFKDTCELVFNLTVSDPKLTNEVAEFIESDFRHLYLTIIKNELGDIVTSSKKIECFEKSDKEECGLEKLLERAEK